MVWTTLVNQIGVVYGNLKPRISTDEFDGMMAFCQEVKEQISI